MNNKNAISSTVAKINKLPAFARKTVMSKLFGGAIKYAGHSGIRFEKLTNNECTVSIKNKRKVQNHIGGVHAIAQSLLAETCTGFVVGMNAPDTSVTVIKSMTIDFVKRSTGDMQATAKLTDDQVQQIQNDEKGELVVDVVITDSVNVEPIKAQMTWVWIPKKR